MKEYKCPICGEKFNDYSSNKRVTCSIKCRNKHFSDIMKKANPFQYKKNFSISEKTKRKIGEANKGEKSGLWKGGRSTMGGYIKIWIAPNKYILEHRQKMEKYLKRKLLNTEVVHHINGIRDDNRIENLLLCKNRREHGIIHKGQRIEPGAAPEPHAIIVHLEEL